MQALQRQQILQAALSQHQHQMQQYHIGQTFVEQPHLQQTQLSNSTAAYQVSSFLKKILFVAINISATDTPTCV